MKIALASTFVPFGVNPYRSLSDSLAKALLDEGHDVEEVWLPQVDTPDLLIPQMLAFRLVDLAQANFLICLRPQAHMIAHPNKVVWLVEEPLAGANRWRRGGQPVDGARAKAQLDAVRTADTRAFGEAMKVFAGSSALQAHLLADRGVGSMLLKPPLDPLESADHSVASNTLVCVSAYGQSSRLHVIIEALAFASPSLRLRVFGTGCDPGYRRMIEQLVSGLGLGHRVVIEFDPTPDEVVTSAVMGCLAVIDLEEARVAPGDGFYRAVRSARCVIASTDGGAVLDDVVDGMTGVITDPEPRCLASKLNLIHDGTIDPGVLGSNLRGQSKTMSWSETIAELLA